MSIGDNDPWTQVTSSGSSEEAYSFLIFASSDLRVYQGSTLQSSGDYSVLAASGGQAGGVSPDTGGVVQWTSTVVTPASGVLVTIDRDIARERTTNFPVGGNISPATLDDQIDRVNAYQQEDEYTHRTRTIKFTITSSEIASTGLEVPSATGRANLVLGFTSTGAVQMVAASTVTTVSDLGDVFLDGIADNNFLVYESTSTGWVNRDLLSSALLSITHSTDNAVISVDVSTGSTGQVQTVSATGVIWADQVGSTGTIVEAAEGLRIAVRNASGGTILHGAPVYVTGFHAGSTAPTIDEARANSTATMPAVGVLSSDIANNANGEVIEFGLLSTFDTSTSSVGDGQYVSAASSGTLTVTKPEGSTILIQRLGTVVRSQAANGQILIQHGGRANALPNYAQHALHLDGNDLTDTTGDFYWYSTAGMFSVGTSDQTGARLTALADTNMTNIALPRASTDEGAAPTITFRRAAGTAASPTVVLSTDRTLQILAEGYTGTGYIVGAAILANMDGTPGAADMPMRWEFHTVPDGSTALVERLRISQDGEILVAPTASLNANRHLDFVAQSTFANPSSTNVRLGMSTNTPPHVFVTTSTGGKFGAFKYIPRDGGLNVFSDAVVNWSSPASIAITISTIGISGQTVGITTVSTDEFRMLTSLAGGSSNTDFWFRNTTRSQNVFVSATGVSAASSQLIVSANFDISAWSSGDAITWDVDIGNFSDTASVWVNLARDITAQGIERAVGAVFNPRLLDVGAVSSQTGSPQIITREIGSGRFLDRLFGQVAERSNGHSVVLPLLTTGASTDENMSFAVSIFPTGSQTFFASCSVEGYYTE